MHNETRQNPCFLFNKEIIHKTRAIRLAFFFLTNTNFQVIFHKFMYRLTIRNTKR